MNWTQFGEKLQLALESSHDADPEGGVAGIEVEFNIVDSELRPVVSAPGGSEDGGFSDWFLAERIPPEVRDRFQLEVFSWMTEVATAPYWSVRAAVSEARTLEAVLFNALADGFGELDAEAVVLVPAEGIRLLGLARPADHRVARANGAPSPVEGHPGDRLPPRWAESCADECA